VHQILRPSVHTVSPAVTDITANSPEAAVYTRVIPCRASCRVSAAAARAASSRPAPEGPDPENGTGGCISSFRGDIH
jgi:hypothetical protein